jgi:hypothetical protein
MVCVPVHRRVHVIVHVNMCLWSSDSVQILIFDDLSEKGSKASETTFEVRYKGLGSNGTRGEKFGDIQFASLIIQGSKG